MNIGDFVSIKSDFADLVLGCPQKGSSVKIMEVEVRDGMYPLIHFKTQCGIQSMLFSAAFQTAT